MISFLCPRSYQLTQPQIRWLSDGPQPFYQWDAYHCQCSGELFLYWFDTYDIYVTRDQWTYHFTVCCSVVLQKTTVPVDVDYLTASITLMASHQSLPITDCPTPPMFQDYIAHLAQCEFEFLQNSKVQVDVHHFVSQVTSLISDPHMKLICTCDDSALNFWLLQMGMAMSTREQLATIIGPTAGFQTSSFLL